MRSLRVVVSRGRKPVLTLFEKLAVGGECERLWQALAEQQAMARYRNRPNLRDVKKIQSDLASVPVASRGHRVWQDTRRRASSEIVEIFSDIETQPIRARRPYRKRTEILDAAIKCGVARRLVRQLVGGERRIVGILSPL
jgi:hypothetical protein